MTKAGFAFNLYQYANSTNKAMELEEAKYITKTKQGRRNTYSINSKGKFRHPSEKNKSIGALLAIFE